MCVCLCVCVWFGVSVSVSVSLCVYISMNVCWCVCRITYLLQSVQLHKEPSTPHWGAGEANQTPEVGERRYV